MTASDAQLLASARSDPEAFTIFYERYEAAGLGYLLRRTRDPELAADLGSSETDLPLLYGSGAVENAVAGSAPGGLLSR